MSLSWPVHRNILRQAVIGERARWVLGWTIVAAVLSALGGLLGVVFNLPPMKARLWCVVPLASLALFMWLRYVPGAVRQNSPANARLVPGLNRSVRRVTVLIWCLALAPMALVAAAFDHVALVFITLGVTVTAIGMARGGRKVGTVIYVLLVLAILFINESPGLKAWLSAPAPLAALSLGGIALAWDALCTVFPAGGERHWKLLPAQAIQRVGGDMHQAMLLNRASGGPARLYAPLLRRDLRAGVRTDHLLLHALGPNNHRYDFVVPLACVALLAVAVRLAMSSLGLAGAPVAVGLGIIGSFAGPLILLQGLTFHRHVVSINNTRGEQALVRLSPRAPRADHLGPVLARQLLAICLVEWLAGGLGVLGMMVLFGGGMECALLVVSWMAISVAMSGCVLRDYAGRHPDSLLELGVQIVMMGIGGIALLVVSDNLAAWSALLVLMLGGAYAIVRGRWKTMVSSPAPFPAGRFA